MASQLTQKANEHEMSKKSPRTLAHTHQSFLFCLSLPPLQVLCESGRHHTLCYLKTSVAPLCLECSSLQISASHDREGL